MRFIESGDAERGVIPINLTMRGLLRASELTGRLSMDLIGDIVGQRASESELLQLLWQAVSDGQRTSGKKPFVDEDDFLEWHMEQHAIQMMESGEFIGQLQEEGISDEEVPERLEKWLEEHKSPKSELERELGTQLGSYFAKFSKAIEKKRVQNNSTALIPDHD